MTAPTSQGQLSLLHVVLSISPTSSQYNEHCLPVADIRDISVCTFFPPRLKAPVEITVFPGDGTIRGFIRVLRRALRASRYDAVHAHSPHVGTMLLIALLLNGGFLTMRRKTVYTLHDSFPNYKRRNRLLLIPIFALFQEVVFCGGASDATAPRLLRFLARGRTQIVENGVDIDRIDRFLASTTEKAHHGVSVVAVGRLEPVKDPLLLLEAFSRVPNERSTLSLVGKGSLEAELRDRMGSLGLGRRVTMTGLIPREEVYRILADADFFISVSRGEGLPVAVLEAMACACPVILSDIPPHREIAADAQFIPLVRPGDAAAFATEIERFQRMSTGERTELGSRCRNLVATRFSLPAMHQGYERIYLRTARHAAG